MNPATPPIQPERERCPTCGSDDPAYKQTLRGPSRRAAIRTSSHSSLCPDPFHPANPHPEVQPSSEAGEPQLSERKDTPERLRQIIEEFGATHGVPPNEDEIERCATAIEEQVLARQSEVQPPEPGCTCIEENDAAVATSSVMDCPKHADPASEVQRKGERFTLYVCRACGWITGEEQDDLSCFQCGEPRAMVEQVEAIRVKDE